MANKYFYDGPIDKNTSVDVIRRSKAYGCVAGLTDSLFRMFIRNSMTRDSYGSYQITRKEIDKLYSMGIYVDKTCMMIKRYYVSKGNR